MVLKKIKFNEFRGEKLKYPEMRYLLGGTGSDDCPYPTSGTCAWHGGTMGGGCDISLDDVLCLVEKYGGRWCCDSCSEASWYNC